jgi:hypothetical protein
MFYLLKSVSVVTPNQAYTNPKLGSSGAWSMIKKRGYGETQFRYIQAMMGA